MLKLIKSHPQLLLFGMLAAMFSGPGQTFLVSIFIPHMRESFEMSRTEIAGVYAAATLASALILPLMGNLLDRIHLTKFTLIAGLFLAVGCVVLSQSTGIIYIFIGFLLIRNLGQGTLTMISSTTMARVFGAHRGKAISIANLGYPLGEAIFPLAVSSWILYFSWRSGWLFLAALTVLFFMPAVWILLRNNIYEKTKKALSKEGAVEKEISETLHETAHWSLKDVVKGWRFYVLIFPIMAAPAFLTALFFHQGSIADWKGWSLQAMSAGFIAFALARGLFSLLSGPVIDRYGARRLFPFGLMPYAIGLIFLVLGDSIFWVFAYLACSGVTLGISMTTGSALLAEIYGTKYLGSIRGFISFFVVFSTAATPPVLGWMLDEQINFSAILWGTILLTGIAIVMSWIACRGKQG